METTERNRLAHRKNSFGQTVWFEDGTDTDYRLAAQEFRTPGTLPDSDYYAARMTPALCDIIRPLVPSWDDPADWKVTTFRVVDGCPTDFRDGFPADYSTALHHVEIIPASEA